MPRPQKWPSYALWALEDIQTHPQAIDALAREAQQHTLTGKTIETVVALSEIRVRAIQAVNLAVQARTGTYAENQEPPDKLPPLKPSKPNC